MLDSAGVVLVSRREENASNAAREAWLEGGQSLHELTESLVDEYFRQHAAKTKKAEWQEMQRLDIYTGSYRDYLRTRAEGKSLGQIGYGLRNRAWLVELAKEAGRDSELEQLVTESEARKAAWLHAAQCVRRWPLKSDK